MKRGKTESSGTRRTVPYTKKFAKTKNGLPAPCRAKARILRQLGCGSGSPPLPSSRSLTARIGGQRSPPMEHPHGLNQSRYCGFGVSLDAFHLKTRCAFSEGPDTPWPFCYSTRLPESAGSPKGRYPDRGVSEVNSARWDDSEGLCLDGEQRRAWERKLMIGILVAA